MTSLLVASGGGHLKQLHRLLPRLGIGPDRIWVTFDTGLSRSLLAHERVLYAPYAHPHDVKGTAKDMWFATHVLRNHDIDLAVSTGANLAVAFLPLARLWGANAHYIETATRADGPSLTGKVLQKLPGIDLYTQHPSQAGRRWKYEGSVFEGFVAKHEPLERPVQKIVVTLGSNDSYSFDRLVRHVQAITPAGVDIFWQLGSTTSDVPGGRATVPAAELTAAMREADVVIAHAGTGSALSALEVGKYPVLVPRRAAHHEHVDDHQELTTRYLSGLGLALAAEADELTWDDVTAAANWRVTERNDVRPFSLKA